MEDFNKTIMLQQKRIEVTEKMAQKALNIYDHYVGVLPPYTSHIQPMKYALEAVFDYIYDKGNMVDNVPEMDFGKKDQVQ